MTLRRACARVGIMVQPEPSLVYHALTLRHHRQAAHLVRATPGFLKGLLLIVVSFADGEVSLLPELVSASPREGIG